MKALEDKTYSSNYMQKKMTLGIAGKEAEVIVLRTTRGRRFEISVCKN
jgi:hypothetical protein